jgi:hypothetical protein
MLIARLYGITDRELAHLLRRFQGMANKRPAYLTLLTSSDVSKKPTVVFQ